MRQNSVRYIMDSWCPSGTHYISVGASMVPIHTLDSVELFSINMVYSHPPLNDMVKSLNSIFNSEQYVFPIKTT